MNNIQKMENKAYKAYIKELESKAWAVNSSYYEWVLTCEGRRHVLRGIRDITKIRKYIRKDISSTYLDLKRQRDYSLEIIKSRG